MKVLSNVEMVLEYKESKREYVRRLMRTLKITKEQATSCWLSHHSTNNTVKPSVSSVTKLQK